jgi:peptidoglycan/LPS O-acetylase OafA/YrhL
MNRLAHVDFLRGLAALAVVYFHLAGSTGLSEQIKYTGIFGHLGVEMFFVISGFVLPWSMHRGAYRLGLLKSFLLRRYVRLFPPYLAAIVLSLLVGAATQWTRYDWPSWSTVLGNVFYISPVINKPWISPVFWTLGIELQFYLFLGVLYRLIIHRSHLWSILACLLVTYTGIFWSNTCILASWFGLFSLGIVTFRYLAMEMSLARFLTACAIFTGMISIITGFVSALAGLTTALTIAFVRLSPRASASRWSRALGWLGAISYSLYLVHWEIGRGVTIASRKLPIVGNSEVIRLGLGLIASLVFAALFYWFIEKPAVRASHAIGRSTPTIAPEPAIACSK